MSIQEQARPLNVIAKVHKHYSLKPYTPEQIKKAYFFGDVDQGEGIHIVVIVAYGNPWINQDVKFFSEYYNIAPIELNIIYPAGQPSKLEKSWQTETSLDVEWIHALAPKAKLTLVVAKDASQEQLYRAIKYGIGLRPQVMSMSIGFKEFAQQKLFDTLFLTPGIVYVAASGDRYHVTYPASSPYVIGVGGTSLQLDEEGIRQKEEIAWYESGGGISKFEMKPIWQNIPSDAVPVTNRRTIPDMSFFSDIFPGFHAYVTHQRGNSSWYAVGGTSVATACIAAIYANAIKPYHRLYNAPTNLYRLAFNGTDQFNQKDVFIDIENGNTPRYPALRGYDYVTGLGSVRVDRFISYLRSL